MIGCGITGWVQVNNTHLHQGLKSEYRKDECDLMLEKLQNEPTGNEMMKIIPPKGIKRNKEGSELMDGDEISESDVPDDESDSEQRVDVSQLLEALDGEILRFVKKTNLHGRRMEIIDKEHSNYSNEEDIDFQHSDPSKEAG